MISIAEGTRMAGSVGRRSAKEGRLPKRISSRRGLDRYEPGRVWSAGGMRLGV